jgi:hypothetical protein
METKNIKKVSKVFSTPSVFEDDREGTIFYFWGNFLAPSALARF